MQQPPADQDIDTIAGRCQARLLRFDDRKRTEQEKFFDFGARWRCLKAIHLGQGEALAEIELPKPYKDDVLKYHLHPALLDLATGAALYLIENYGQSASVYLPMSYAHARAFRSLPAAFFSHIRSRQRNEAGHDVATFDLTLLDEQGKVLVEIEGFSMRLIRDPENGLRLSRDRLPTQTASIDGFADRPRRGIAPADGVKALTRILSSGASQQVFVLPDGLGALPQSPQSPVKPPSNNASPKDDVHSVLVEWWQELLGVDHVELDDDFFEIGGHSLIVVRLFSKINRKYEINLGLSTMFEARTVRSLAKLICDVRKSPQSQPSLSRAIVPIQSTGSRPPLYVISGVGGNVIRFQSMAFHLGKDQPVYGLLPRGMDGHEAYLTRVEDIAAYYVDAIRKQQPEGPYRLVGYSFGGTVAFEVAQQLMAQGGNVTLLGLFDTIEWHYREAVKKSFGFRATLAVYRSKLKEAALEGDRFRPVRKRLKRKFLRIISPLFRALGDVVKEPRGAIEDVNVHAGANYQPRFYPGRLTLFRSSSREPWDGDDEFLGWGGLAGGGIEVHHIPSDHYTILLEPGVKVLSEKLRGCLDRDISPNDPGIVAIVRSNGQDDPLYSVGPSFR
jgi:thioesterase domain-containing protein/acyl carrier protein